MDKRIRKPNPRYFSGDIENDTPFSHRTVVNQGGARARDPRTTRGIDDIRFPPLKGPSLRQRSSLGEGRRLRVLGLHDWYSPCLNQIYSHCWLQPF